jgi:hypothetical protein
VGKKGKESDAQVSVSTQPRVAALSCRRRVVKEPQTVVPSVDLRVEEIGGKVKCDGEEGHDAEVEGVAGEVEAVHGLWSGAKRVVEAM